MRAFLEKINKEWLDDFVYMSKQPLLELEVEVIPFDTVLYENHSDLLKHKPTKEDIVIGSVDACTAFFKAIGVSVPSYLGYPEELKPYLNRDIQVIKFGKIEPNAIYPYFIKPKNEVKLFTGCVVENERQYNIVKDHYKVPSETELYASQVIDILSEYRCFVYKGELKGIRHYQGDFKIFPNFDTIKNMIDSYKSSNSAYVLDVGIIRVEDKFHGQTNKTILVEINDMWGLGSYGFDAKTYVRMVISRFREIIKNSIN